MKPATVSGGSAPRVLDSIADLIRLINDGAWGNHTNLWFRGQSCAGWDVATSIWRDYQKEDELNFTNRFRVRAATRHNSVPRYDDCALWLSLMQHYGLPTRLLDWTRSPLIAAYFALASHIERSAAQAVDAAIWILKPHVLNASEGFGGATPSMEARMCRKMVIPAFTDKWAETGKVLAAMTSETDLRMFVQQGCFTIHSQQKAINTLEGAAEWLSLVLIPADRVVLMAKEIDACGFRKGDIFPDLSHLAEELKESYPPRRKP